MIFSRSNFLFSLRATIASIMALWIGIALKLESPHWAAITVWVVTQPSRGKTLSKGFYRFLGTAIGALFAVFLIYFFDQSPWIFILLLALWVGFTTAFANLVQYFCAYGTMLAGFTAALVGMTVFSHPDQVVHYAQSRVASILLGIAVALVMASFLNQSSAKNDLHTAVDRVLSQTLLWIGAVFRRLPRPELVERERNLITEISLLEELTTYAAAESLQVRRQRRKLHSFIATLFQSISAARAVGLHLRKFPELDQQTKSFRDQCAEMYEGGSVHEIPLVEFGPAAKHKVLSDRWGHLMRVTLDLRDQHHGLNNPSLLNSAKTLAYHRDLRHAKAVGLRSVLAVLTAGALWIFSGWALGPIMIIMTAVNCGIFATNNNPRSGHWVALKASLLAMVAAFGCLQLMQYGPQNIYFLFLLMAMVLIPGGLLIPHPTRSLAGTLFCANFLVFLTPAFPFRNFSLDAFLGLGLGFFASLVFTFAFYTFILPSDPGRRGRNMVQDLIRDLERMAKAPNDDRASEWETLMYNRVSQLIKVLAETGEVGHGVLEGSFAVLDMGQEILALQAKLANKNSPVRESEIIQQALSELSTLSENPARVAQTLAQCSADCAELSPPSSQILAELAEQIKLNEAYFRLL